MGILHSDINLYSTSLPKLKWRDADSIQWEQYCENINLDHWSEISDENMTLNDKVNLLIDKIQDAAEEGIWTFFRGKTSYYS